MNAPAMLRQIARFQRAALRCMLQQVHLMLWRSKAGYKTLVLPAAAVF